MPIDGSIETTRYNQYKQRSARYLSLFDAEYQATHNKNILELMALKKVVKSKLKRLVNDPRPYATLKDEIIKTEQELYAINHDILQEVIGKDACNHILNHLFKNKKNEIKLKTLSNLFFNNKNISISKKFKQLPKQELDENILKKEAELEYAKRFFSYNNTKKQYWISRVGKVIAANYAISQVASLGFMCAIILIGLYPIIVPVLLTAIWWVPVVYFGGGALLIAWFMNGTGRINWDGCRDSVPNMLIEFWSIFNNKTDVAYTWTQKIRLFATLLECAICGAVSGFFVDYIIIDALILLFGGSSAIVALAPIITIPLAIFAALNMFLFMYKFSYATILRGIAQDFKIFIEAIFATDYAKIDALKTQLIADYKQRYQHIYFDKKLEEKVNQKFDDSILGIILNFNSKAIKEKSFVSSTYFRAVAMLFAAFICAPLIILGIIYGQLAAYQGLALFLDGFMGFANQASKLLCFFSGTAYMSSFTYFTVKSAAKSLYAKSDDEASNKNAIEMQEIKDDPDFPQRRLANSADNGAQTGFGYMDSRRKEQENGELEPLEDAIVHVAQDPSVFAGFFVFTGAATLASYVFASAPEKSKDYNETLNVASRKLTVAFDNTKKRQASTQSSEALDKLQTQQTRDLTSSIIPSFTFRGFSCQQ